MREVEAVLFDLDDTLVRYERPPGEVLRASFESVGSEPLFSVEEYYARFDEFAENCDSMAELRSECFAALADENGYERQLGRNVADAFRRERDQTNVELFPSAARVLDELGREYRLGIVTNGTPDAQRQKIDAANLARRVDAIVVAGRDVPPKPDPKPFERAVRALDAAPATAVHVGDSLETDVAGASAAGLDSVWISERDGAREHTPTHRIASIGDLLSPPWGVGSQSGPG
jgi:putative hydrolase of the HAD superfamily